MHGRAKWISFETAESLGSILDDSFLEFAVILIELTEFPHNLRNKRRFVIIF